MSDVFVVGVGSTVFDKMPNRSIRELSGEAVQACLADAGFDGADVQSIAFGNCAMGRLGQNNLRGQVSLEPLMASGTLSRRVPITNVEAGCATGSLAMHTATRAVASGDVQVALAVGAEKTVVPDDPARMLAIFADGIDTLHPDEWKAYFAEQAASVSERFEPHPYRVLFLDLHALLARRHMHRFGLTTEQLAATASKNHGHAVHNEKAQYRTPMSIEDIVADKPVLAPLTRGMCAPLSDGAAACLVVNADVLAGLDPAVRARAVRVHAAVQAGGAYRGIDDESVSHAVGAKTWSRSGWTPKDVDVAEVHDATAFCELLHLEGLGFADAGQAGAMAAAGETTLGGRIPTNTSGGLESKGHPLAATGLGQVGEIVQQLRHEAGERQVVEARRGLVHNAGGAIGLDEAVAAVTLLERV